MATSVDSSNSSSSETNADQVQEYYVELDNQTLDIRKQKPPTPIPTKSFVKEPSPPVVVIDPIQKLNAQLNRQFRPDLVLPSPSPSPPPISPEPNIKQTPSSDPVIFDSRHPKSIKPSTKKTEPTVSFKQKLLSRFRQLTESTTESISSSGPQMSDQQTNIDGFQVPPGMMLVPAPQQQPFPKVIEPSQQSQTYATTSQYKPPTMTYNNSIKNNKVAPPPSTHNAQTAHQMLPNNSFQTPSSILSTNPLIQPPYPSKQQHSLKHIDQLKSSKKKHKKGSIDDQSNTKNTNRSFALYNQKNGRIEGVVKNRLNVATDDAEESRIVDEETKPKSKWMLWLSQPLCLGLTRLSGGVLFGSMILLGCASIAGLIVSIVLYTQDSVTDAQWKILGMVICAIMLITIIITLSIFICCYKHGYMFDKDDDIDPTDPSTTQDGEGNERQKAFLRKIYKFNRPNNTPPIPSDIPHHVSTSPPPQPSIQVNDKQTNTEATIAFIRPKDFERGVWPSTNAYGGISYRPLMPPQMVSRFIQVLPHEIEEIMQPQPQQIIYQVVAPAAAIPPTHIQPRIIQIPTQPASAVEYIEATQKQQPRIIQIPPPQGQGIEYIETSQRQPRKTKIRQPQTQQVVVQPSTRIEYIDVEEQRGRRLVQQPQYEIVEEYYDPSTSSIEEIVEIVDAPRHTRHRGRKKEKKNGFGKVSVKHLKASDE